MSDTKQNHFMSLYTPVHEAFQRYCRACARNDEEAKDLVGETLLRAYEGLDRLRNEEAFLSFLFGIARRVHLNLRRRDKFRGSVGEHYFDRVPSGSADPDLRHDVNLLYRALAELPEIYRESFILYEISGFPMKEIARIQSCSLSAAKVRVMRARNRLAEMLSAGGRTGRSEFSSV